MSRSIGDWVAESVGVISDPEILEYSITSDDRFIVMGSDGIFDFIKNEEIVKITVPYWLRGDVQGACNALAKEARHRWQREEEVIDDITCVVVFL
jgi:serine/threonine protein phosphatase PrpC